MVLYTKYKTRLSDQIKKQDLTIYSSEETHVKYKQLIKLEVKGWKTDLCKHSSKESWSDHQTKQTLDQEILLEIKRDIAKLQCSIYLEDKIILNM